ncbi:MAG: GNAT family N-acetyltransferase [Candidatus Zixiibacteriota bacterium]
MTIRVLTRDDAPAFREFRLEGLRNHPEAFGESAEEFAALSTEEIAGRIPADGNLREGFILGAYDEERLVGVTCLWRSKRMKSRHHATLWGMHVAASVRRQGIGEMLVRDLLARARTIEGLELVKLTAATANERAWKLYEKCGFTVFGIEPKALRINGVDYEQLHMMIDLTKVLP